MSVTKEMFAQVGLSDPKTGDPIIAETEEASRGLVRELVHDAAWEHEHDPWGSGMMALFMLEDVLRGIDGDGSEIVEFIGRDELDSARLLFATFYHGVSDESVEYFYRVVDRYLDIVKAAGRDY